MFLRRGSNKSRTESVRIDGNGNVGIGTSRPATKLHGYGASGDITSTVQSGSVSGRFLTNANGTYVGTTTDNDFTIQTNSIGRVTVKNTGNVGIGTNSPDVTLHISDGGAANDTPEVKISSFRPIIRLHDKSSSASSAEICGDNSLIFRCSVPVDDNTPLTEHMRINALGDVGIGTTSPGAKLEVSEAGATDGILLRLNNGVNAAGTEAGLSILQNSTDQLRCNLLTDREGLNAGVDFKIELSDSAGTIQERFRIKESGNVGIGTSSPGATLEVSGADQTTSALDTSNLTVSVKSSTLVANSGGSLGFGAATKQWAGIKGLVLNGNDNSIGDLSFSTRRVTTDSTLTEAMRITYNGNVGIGTTSPNNILSIASAAPRLEITDTTTSARFLIDAESTVGSVNFRVDPVPYTPLTLPTKRIR